MKLEATKHDYYCECWENTPSEFASWEEFVQNEHLDLNQPMGIANGYDLDYNLPFRFDIENMVDENGEDIPDKFLLKMHHAQQRHGRILWHIVINNITEKDMPDIERYLKICKKKIASMWKEVK